MKNNKQKQKHEAYRFDDDGGVGVLTGGVEVIPDDVDDLRRSTQLLRTHHAHQLQK